MSLLSLLAQQIAQKQTGPQMGQAQGQPLPFSGPPPQMPPVPPPDSLPRAPGGTAFAPDATNAHQPAPAQGQHPHWWGRLILGQGEFAPGTFLGTAADIAPPTMGLRAGASMAASHSGMGDLLAALPLIPGGGEAAAPVEGLVHDIAPAAKDEVASVMAQQAQREGHLPWGRSTSALEKIRPEDEQSLYELFQKQGVRPKPLPNY